jgi:hypothetical protein
MARINSRCVGGLRRSPHLRRLARLVARYGRLDLLVIDEVGYVQLDARGAELLFQAPPPASARDETAEAP